MKDLLTKSIDELVDQLFAEDALNKSALDIKQDAKTTADAVVNQAPSAQNDDARGAGRPKQISDVPAKDEDGKRDGSYDASITSAQAASDVPEASQVKEPAKMKKSVEISEEDYAQFEAFKKAESEKIRYFLFSCLTTIRTKKAGLKLRCEPTKTVQSPVGEPEASEAGSTGLLRSKRNW